MPYWTLSSCGSKFFHRSRKFVRHYIFREGLNCAYKYSIKIAILMLLCMTLFWGVTVSCLFGMTLHTVKTWTKIISGNYDLEHYLCNL